MADFVKEWQKNVRFSVNRDERILLKVSRVERAMWLKLASVLQERRNTGPQIETFLYLLRKYNPIIEATKKAGRAEWKTVSRDKFILFKVNHEENILWLELVEKYGSSKVDAFLHIIDKEFNFQDEVETINE